MAMDMRSMVAALAQMPESQRKTMMRERLEMFASMNDLERASAMRQMMEAVGTLPRDGAKKLLTTRTEILFELPEATRMKLMQTHMSLLQQIGPERAMAEMEIVKEITPTLSPAARQGVEQMMKMMPMPAMAGAGGMGGGGGAMASPRPVSVAASAAAPRFAGWANGLLWLAAIAGALLVIAPFVLNYASNAARTTDIVFGVALAVVTGGIAIARPARDSGGALTLLWLSVAAGAVLVIAPFVLGYTGTVAQVTDTVLGLAVAILTGIVAIWRPAE